MLQVDMVSPKDTIMDDSIIYDIERQFRLLSIDEMSRSDKVREVIAEVEQGKYEGKSYFIDRFGNKLGIENLSTGCKAAIIMVCGINKKVSLLECGTNAIVSIFKHVYNGDVIMYSRDSMFDTLRPERIQVDIALDGYRFTNLARLNYYITDERGYDVDLGMEGIQCLQ